MKKQQQYSQTTRNHKEFILKFVFQTWQKVLLTNQLHWAVQMYIKVLTLTLTYPPAIYQEDTDDSDDIVQNLTIGKVRSANKATVYRKTTHIETEK